MKRIALFTLTLALGAFSSSAQTTITVGPGAGFYEIPACLNGDIQIILSGGQGGGIAGQTAGGAGATLDGFITVSGGDIITYVVGDAGGCPTAGTGGGAGQISTQVNATWDACGGGGASTVSLNGVLISVASAGGGAGGGSVTNNVGGAGGCANGMAGGNTFGQGGQGGTQAAGGAGGTPWAGTPPGGSAGALGQGGLGGFWQTASGGGGGGGFFGGGGGGNDGCCPGGNGGGGGGGGSSLIPAGVGCIVGANTGDGGFTMIIPDCDETVLCSGDTAFVDFTDFFPLGAIGFSAAGGPFVQAGAGNPIIGFEPVDTTTYVITATIGGAPVAIDWIVNAVDPIFPNAGLDDSLCFDLANAAALNGTLDNDGIFFWQLENVTTFSGGFGNALFTPDNLTINTTINANQAGLYEFILFEEDTNDVCPIASDTMFVYYSVEDHVATPTDPDCYLGANGQIVIDSDDSPASGDLGANNYSIDNGATWQTSNTFAGLTAGVYDVISEDYLGCQFASQVELFEPLEITVTLASSDTVICQNGTATINAFGSNAPAGGTYTYDWTPNNSITGSNVITPAPVGTDVNVSVFVTTDLGCVSQVQSLDITHHDPIVLTMTTNDSVCPGYDSQHTVNAVGGFNGYNYAWTANGTAMADISEEVNINPTGDTEYCITTSDVCETTPVIICTNTIMRNIPAPLFTSDATWGCNPTDIVFSNITDPNDSDSLTWLINGTYYYNQDPLVIAFEEIGSYDVWLEVYSEYGCFNSINAIDYITIHDVPNPLFYINPNPTTIFNTGLEMNNITAGANNTYLWSLPGGSPATSSLVSPSVYYPEGVPADYPILLVATNEWGCSDSINGVAQIVSDVIIYAPNIFTPDGDEFNETWQVYIDGIDIYDFHLTMYNRWGEPVWESYNQSAEWKGSYGPNGIQDGTYVWKIECKEIATDKKYEFRGHVTVLK
jgi:gliding motility-associated-like protein